MSRPAVSLVVPFTGAEGEARELLATLAGLDRAAGDELIVADNTASGVVARLDPEGIAVVAAAERRSASFARNAGAGAASGEWLLFTDADCVPPAGLLDEMLAPAVGERCGVVAGEVEGLSSQVAPLARWARSRRGSWVERHISAPPAPAGVTANLAVRRVAFEQLGGFRIGGGGDLDLCWRAAERGWQLEYRPEAVVAHRDRERWRELAAQAVAYGGHQRRLRELHGEAVPRVTLARHLARALGGGAAWAVRGERERASFKLADGVWAACEWWGWVTRGARARRAD